MAEADYVARRVHRRAARHLRRRASAHQGAAQAGQGGQFAGAARGLRIAPRGNQRPDRTAGSRCSQSLDEKVRGKHCDGIAGIIEEGTAIMKEDFDETTMDACLIAAGQRAEHYEMAAYGTLVAWARAMGHTEAADAAAGNTGRGEGGRREAVGAGRRRHQPGSGQRAHPQDEAEEEDDPPARPVRAPMRKAAGAGRGAAAAGRGNGMRSSGVKKAGRR